VLLFSTFLKQLNLRKRISAFFQFLYLGKVFQKHEDYYNADLVEESKEKEKERKEDPDYMHKLWLVEE
jgi:hypothetical protein